MDTSSADTSQASDELKEQLSAKEFKQVGLHFYTKEFKQVGLHFFAKEFKQVRLHFSAKEFNQVRLHFSAKEFKQVRLHFSFISLCFTEGSSLGISNLMGSVKNTLRMIIIS